jgi:flagellar motor switch/type III secretory pathway protein FliN
MDGLAQAFRDMLGVPVDVLVRGAQRLVAAHAIADGVGVLIAPADSMDTARGALIEAEGALAANVVARALKRTPPHVLDTGSAPSLGIAGAMAAVLLAGARRAHTGTAPRVLAAGPARALECDLARLAPDLLAISLTVLVADDAFAARVVLSRSATQSAPSPPWNAKALAALGSMPLAVPVVACATWVSVAELAALRRGDALVACPGGSWPLARDDDGDLEGPVFLAPATSDVGLCARLCKDGRLVLGPGLEPLVATETRMDSHEKDAVAVALGDVPIVVRVEIGEALMAAREWASLGRGDVVALGRRVGEPVLLRVGGVLVARGELVEIDGEVAVRILDRAIGDGTTP